jgi:hypothetical protein
MNFRKKQDDPLPRQAFSALSNKHSSLLQKLVNHGHKKFYNIVTWGQCYKTFYSRKLQIFVAS